MNSLDPRVNRLPPTGHSGHLEPKAALDQFGTFEVFVQPKDGKPFQHEGIVHSPNLAMAFVLAKETFTRRFTCISLYVVETKNILTSPLTEGDNNVYDLLGDGQSAAGPEQSFEIFHLAKRGKQHVHAGTVSASSPQQVFFAAKEKLNSGKIVTNIWAVRTSDIHFTADDEKDFWLTLPEKKFRDAGDYKGGDKLKNFLDSKSSTALSS